MRKRLWNVAMVALLAVPVLSSCSGREPISPEFRAKLERQNRYKEVLLSLYLYL